MLLKEIISFLESMAHPSVQESYDNSGLIVGESHKEIRSALICLDSTPEVIEEARRIGADLVIAHHPIVFSGLKKFNRKNYVERAIMDAIRHDIAIYAIHTNLDNVAMGVNKKISDRLGLTQTRILDPKSGLLRKVVVFVPHAHADAVRSAMFSAGAGEISAYSSCSFNVPGVGTFQPGEGSNPFVGQRGQVHSEEEIRVEVLVPAWKLGAVETAMKAAHPYEEVAWDIYTLENSWAEMGAGMIGNLPEPMPLNGFLDLVKKQMHAPVIRHTRQVRDHVQRIAVCGGSGSFLLKNAISAGADVLVTSDFKYHQFFDADGQIVIADIGHFESEQFTMELLNDWIRQKFPKFATHLTAVNTNPVHYF